MSSDPGVHRIEGYDEADLLDAAVGAALAGAVEVLEVYRGQFDVERKPDDSPITEADRRSQDVIVAALRARFPSIELLGEEASHAPYAVRAGWPIYWLVDPLDGTKEFVKRNGEFTINIALVEGHHARLGVVYVPVQSLLYAGSSGGALVCRMQPAPLAPGWMPKPGERPALSALEAGGRRLPLPAAGGPEITAVVSRSHLDPATEAFVRGLEAKGRAVRPVSAGSSKKLCVLAEGTADVYPRFSPTMEWDTAAGQAVLEAAGGLMVEARTGRRFRYNKESLRNPEFIALAPGRDPGYYLSDVPGTFQKRGATEDTE